VWDFLDNPRHALELLKPTITNRAMPSTQPHAAQPNRINLQGQQGPLRVIPSLG
jgi:hypothetical protein